MFYVINKKLSKPGNVVFEGDPIFTNTKGIKEDLQQAFDIFVAKRTALESNKPEVLVFSDRVFSLITDYIEERDPDTGKFSYRIYMIPSAFAESVIALLEDPIFLVINDDLSVKCICG